MARVESTKLYLLQQRQLIVNDLVRLGFSDIEIGNILNMERSQIFRIRNYGYKELKRKQKKVS